MSASRYCSPLSLLSHVQPFVPAPLDTIHSEQIGLLGLQEGGEFVTSFSCSSSLSLVFEVPYARSSASTSANFTTEDGTALFTNFFVHGQEDPQNLKHVVQQTENPLVLNMNFSLCEQFFRYVEQHINIHTLIDSIAEVRDTSPTDAEALFRNFDEFLAISPTEWKVHLHSVFMTVIA
jgi:hypothetical protein